VKRRDLIKHLRLHGCVFVREGSDHSIFENPAFRRRTAIPRHREILPTTARLICHQLAVPDP
jgi:predicted RNA binding protein YcfA (HicA-like mRNA interferase family)